MSVKIKPHQITTITQATQVLESYIGKAQTGKYTLDRMRKIMHALDNPQDKIRIIHVAGTSGKTSTCYYIAELLHRHGLKVGLSVSPHITTINERIQVNMKPLAEARYCELLSEFLSILEQTNLQPSYFEMLTAFAFWALYKENVDVAVIEVGLGGLLDCTNVINQKDKICVITEIGLDHVEILGNSLTEIAHQKAGIIQPNNVVIINSQPASVEIEFANTCQKQLASLTILRNTTPALLKHLPQHTVRNLTLARQVTDSMLDRLNRARSTDAQVLLVSQLVIPGRIETFVVNDKTIIIDGSHNPQKLHALASTIHQRFAHTNIQLLVSMGNNKSAMLPEIFRELKRISDSIILTNFTLPTITARTAIDPTVTEKNALVAGFTSIQVIEELPAALRTAFTGNSEVIVVTGSFFLASQARELITSLR